MQKGFVVAASEDNKQVNQEHGASPAAGSQVEHASRVGAASHPVAHTTNHAVKHQPTRYKATGTAPICGVNTSSYQRKKTLKQAMKKASHEAAQRAPHTAQEAQEPEPVQQAGVSQQATAANQQVQANHQARANQQAHASQQAHADQQTHMAQQVDPAQAQAAQKEHAAQVHHAQAQVAHTAGQGHPTQARAAQAHPAQRTRTVQQARSVTQSGYEPPIPPAYIPVSSTPHKHRDRSPVSIIALFVLVLGIGLGIGWTFFWRSVDITVNNETKQVRIGTSLETYLAGNDYFGVHAGKLLSVGGNTLSDDGGDRCSVTRNGEIVAVADFGSTKLGDGDTITVADGADATEEYTEETVDIAPGITKEAGGSIQYVSQWGRAGKKKVWTGKQSGETVDKEVIEEPTQMVVSSRTPEPSDGGKYIALTFDDGPSSYTQQILDILAEKGVKATFFNLGTQAESNPSLTKAVVEGGHELASHTNQHQNLPTLGKDDLRNEITSAFDKLSAASGQTTQMIRAPYGAFTDVEWARSADLISCNVIWNIDTLDWKLPGASAITQNVLSHAFNGAIALMHDGGGNRSQDVEALPDIIDGLKAAGYQLVTVSELMEKDGNFPEDVVRGTVKMPDDAVLPDV